MPSTVVPFFLTYPGSSEGECWRDDAIPYSTLCMGNIYQSDITGIYAALLYPLRCQCCTKHIISIESHY